ncbi:MAG: FAD-dependent oxidoreductase [Crocinitomicaceae bacterium]|nr:FAD-dependent oxidoreductase [Crocinitomicaceae bacterium]
MSKRIVIVGGGVIGLFSAYYLAKSGHKVTVLDKSDLSDGCSYGNAGMIVPSHVIPMAAPGMIAQGVKWMFDSKSPFYVRPRLSSELFAWGMKFYRSANKKHVERSMPALRDLSLLSKKLYQDLFQESKDFLYEEKGLLMLYQSEAVAEEEIHAGKEAQKLGLEVDFLNKEELAKLETGISINAIGGVHYKSDAHLYPNKLMAFLKSELEKMKVEIHGNESVNDFVVEGNRITSVVSTAGNYDADEVVIAGGAWSPQIARKLRMKLSLLPGKGYSFTLRNQVLKPSIPSILCEGKVAVSPMGDDLRFGGTMEITSVKDQKINKKRVEGILNTIHNFYPDLSIQFPETSDIWYGFRPCSPDGLPYIGRSKEIKNAIFATGHAMMGLSLGPATGNIVTSIVNNVAPDVDISLFDVNRF